MNRTEKLHAWDKLKRQTDAMLRKLENDINAAFADYHCPIRVTLQADFGVSDNRDDPRLP